MVGHSLGRLYATLFARLFAQEVEGVVLLEATHPDDVVRLPAHQALLPRAMQKIMDVADGLFGRNPYAEAEFVTDLARGITTGRFPDVPLVVITGGKSPPTWLIPPVALDIRRANQKHFLALSPNSRQLIASRSGHFPQINEPAIVTQGIREILQAASTRR